MNATPSENDPTAVPHRRRPRYPGKYPRKFEHKYKERDPEAHAETIAKVIASGKTPAGTHRPIMVAEILEVLAPTSGSVVVDCTLGFGGHAEAILSRITPGGHLVGLDADPLELPRTEARLRALGFGPEVFTPVRTNFAALPRVLADLQLTGANGILADLGVSSMQIDDPARGFSLKDTGPLDMRMNPNRGVPAAALLARLTPPELDRVLRDNADEPRSAELSHRLAGQTFATTRAFADAIRSALRRLSRDEQESSVRRVFQALRIAVNEEFTALENLLRVLPVCLLPGGRVAILSFHSGEDRRVKHAFEQGLAAGVYQSVSPEVIRPSAAERVANTRSGPARLRWAVKSCT
jgi:16S rRNA (cytosine1402-N4)-methyltransferase